MPHAEEAEPLIERAPPDVEPRASGSLLAGRLSSAPAVLALCLVSCLVVVLSVPAISVRPSMPTNVARSPAQAEAASLNAMTTIAATVTVATDENARMRLFARATVNLTLAETEEATCSLLYYPSTCASVSSACSTPPLYSAPVTFASDAVRTVEMEMWRLIPAHEYKYDLYCVIGSSSGVSFVDGGSGSFWSLSTGYPRFDLRPLGNVTSTVGQSYLDVEMLATIYGVIEEEDDDDDDDGTATTAAAGTEAWPAERRAERRRRRSRRLREGGSQGGAGGAGGAGGRYASDSNDGAYNGTVLFQGVVALNRAGWVVWYFQIADPKTEADPLQTTVFAFLENHQVRSREPPRDFALESLSLELSASRRSFDHHRADLYPSRAHHLQLTNHR